MNPPEIEAIITRAVEENYTTRSALLSGSRDRKALNARRAAIEMMRSNGLAIPVIARYLNLKNPNGLYRALAKKRERSVWGEKKVLQRRRRLEYLIETERIG